eukprot:CAMPEP_0194084582 /NCGR_PEP_ID=MMETSP0149-20130528/13876_1 /TAXON_ID=122233 /ORGANISM="Chaetoceros debilis, Strain MM31A-1" /LENGTH=357 /DNA_ID=CAMNT_0038767267 /DNA_START=48 /DNA_END=1121 /DNA_ORIENTATION=-
MQPLHATSSSLPALNGSDQSNKLSNLNQYPAAAADSESLSLAKNRFRSAVSKGVEVLSHHHGFSRKRAVAFILHHIRTCAMNSNVDSGMGDGDAMVPYPYPNDDEILQTMRKSGLGLDAAAQAVIVSHALKHVQSSQESVSSPIGAIHFLSKELSTMKLLTLVERTTSAIPMPEPFDFKYYGQVGVPVPEKELNMMAKVTSTSIPIVPLSKTANIHSTPTRKHTSRKSSSSSSSSSCSKNATFVKKSKATPATGTGAGCPRPAKVERKRPKESTKEEVKEKSNNTPADVNLNSVNVNVNVDVKQKKTETEVNAKLKVAEIVQSLKSPSPAVTRSNKRANVNVESGQPVSKRQRLDSI